MRSKPSTASATAIPNKPPAELYFGGAADESSRLVLSYAASREARLKNRLIGYFPHYQSAAARRFAAELIAGGLPLALIGHSWGADTALKVAAALDAPDNPNVWLVGADPVSKLSLPSAAFAARPASARAVLHIGALAASPDRSDFVKAAGYLTGGGVPRVFREADSHIRTRLNHWNFAGMMAARGEDGYSAEDWLDAAMAPRLS